MLLMTETLTLCYSMRHHLQVDCCGWIFEALIAYESFRVRGHCQRMFKVLTKCYYQKERETFSSQDCLGNNRGHGKKGFWLKNNPALHFQVSHQAKWQQTQSIYIEMVKWNKTFIQLKRKHNMYSHLTLSSCELQDIFYSYTVQYLVFI